MSEERQPRDPTRKLLRVFGVKVTTYEERATALLERAAAIPAHETEELLQIALELIDLTADMSLRLREMNDHVLATQERMLTDLKAALRKGSA